MDCWPFCFYMFKSKKIGKVVIHVDLINDMIDNPQFHQVFFSAFMPIDAKHDFIDGKITYVGYCDRFDELEAEPVPQYDFEMKRDEDGIIEITGVTRFK